jgi:hypothetical protein
MGQRVAEETAQASQTTGAPDTEQVLKPESRNACSGLILIFAGFVLFDFMTNPGPNASRPTFSPARPSQPPSAEKAPVSRLHSPKSARLRRHFCFRSLLDTIGKRLLLYGLVIASLLGAAVTWLYRIETTGVNPDQIGEPESRPQVAEPEPN